MADAGSELPEDIEVKVATNAAQEFVESYYPAMNNPNGRARLTSFYQKPSPNCKVEISMNGNIMVDPKAVQHIFETDIERSHYDVQSFDCHVINSNYTIGAPAGLLGSDKNAKKMMIQVMVSGSVKYWPEGGEGDVRGFTDVVALTPNWEAIGPKAAKGEKKWLIQNQTFRLVL